MNTDWMEYAKCVGEPLELFVEPVHFRDAINGFCSGCPVAFECREHALVNGDWVTVAGGQTPKERAPEARRRRLPVDANPAHDHNLPKPCGTYAAYRRHRRNGEPPCDECRDAYMEAQRATKGRAA